MDISKLLESTARYPDSPTRASADFAIRNGFPKYATHLGEDGIAKLVEELALANFNKDNKTSKQIINDATAYEKDSK